MTGPMSAQNPHLRLAWDATTLNALLGNPTAYYWEHVLGWRGLEASLPMRWGIVWHEVVAEYLLQRLHGASREDAVHSACRLAITKAGEFEINELAAEAGQDRKKRNVRTLLRSIVWYDEVYGDDDYLEPAYLPHTDSPGLETHFSMPIPDPDDDMKPLKAYTGEPYILAGHIDQIAWDRDRECLVGVERKNTTSTPSGWYWARYDPSPQINTYALVTSMLYPNEKVGGVIIEACQNGVGFTRFERKMVHRTEAHHRQWLRCVCNWIRFAEERAVVGDWEDWLNPASKFDGGVYNMIAAQSPAVWDNFLASHCQREEGLWNPLEHREVEPWTEVDMRK